MTDRELLEKAAKAAGYKVYDWLPNLGFAIDVPWKHGLSNVDRWNPLTDDGDALRLAVKLRLMLNISHVHTEVAWHDEDRSETHSLEQWDNGMTPEEWTRRAIVRAAAAIGEQA